MNWFCMHPAQSAVVSARDPTLSWVLAATGYCARTCPKFSVIAKSEAGLRPVVWLCILGGLGHRRPVGAPVCECNIKIPSERSSSWGTCQKGQVMETHAMQRTPWECTG